MSDSDFDYQIDHTSSGQKTKFLATLVECELVLNMSMFDSLKHTLHTKFVNSVEAITTVSNVSQFHEKGVLTPEEFVAAGEGFSQQRTAHKLPGLV